MAKKRQTPPNVAGMLIRNMAQGNNETTNTEVNNTEDNNIEANNTQSEDTKAISGTELNVETEPNDTSSENIEQVDEKKSKSKPKAKTKNESKNTSVVFNKQGKPKGETKTRKVMSLLYPSVYAELCNQCEEEEVSVNEMINTILIEHLFHK